MPRPRPAPHACPRGGLGARWRRADDCAPRILPPAGLRSPASSRRASAARRPGWRDSCVCALCALRWELRDFPERRTFVPVFKALPALRNHVLEILTESKILQRKKECEPLPRRVPQESPWCVEPRLSLCRAPAACLVPLCRAPPASLCGATAQPLTKGCLPRVTLFAGAHHPWAAEGPRLHLHLAHKAPQGRVRSADAGLR